MRWAAAGRQPWPRIVAIIFALVVDLLSLSHCRMRFVEAVVRSSVRSFVRFLERIQTRRRREEGMKVNGLTCWLRTLTLTTMHLSCCCCFYRRRRRTVGFCPFSRSFLPHPYSIPYPLHKHWACRCTVRGVLSFCRWPYKFNESLSSPSFSFIVSAIVFMPHNH